MGRSNFHTYAALDVPVLFPKERLDEHIVLESKNSLRLPLRTAIFQLHDGF